MDSSHFDVLSSIFKSSKDDFKDGAGRDRFNSTEGMPSVDTASTRNMKSKLNVETNTHSIILPKVGNTYPAPSASKRKVKDVDVQKSKVRKVKPPMAWAEEDADNLKRTESPSRSPQKSVMTGTGSGMGNDNLTASVGSELLLVQQSLKNQKKDVSRDENQARLRLMKNANTMVQRLPLQYLFSKPELKHYAIEHLYNRFRKFSDLRHHSQLVWAFYYWRNPPEIKLNDKQIGFMVLSKALQTMLDRMIGRAFKHWSMFYSMVNRHFFIFNGSSAFFVFVILVV